jgi:hypothetical protein
MNKNEETTNKREFFLKNWKITTEKTKILSKERENEITNTLEITKLPEMIFDSFLQFEYLKSNFKLNFNAQDGLFYGTNDFISKKSEIKEIKVSYEWKNKYKN